MTSSDFVYLALDGLDPVSDAVPAGSKLYHVSKNVKAVVTNGFKTRTQLPDRARAFDHGGYTTDLDRISLTYSLLRAERYRKSLYLLREAAENRMTIQGASDAFFEYASARWDALTPLPPNEAGPGQEFWVEKSWLSMNEIFENTNCDAAFVRSLWVAKAVENGLDAWQALTLLNEAFIKHCDSNTEADLFLPAINVQRCRFLNEACPDLGIIEVQVTPNAKVRHHPEEEEIQVEVADILNFVPLISLG